MRGEKREDKKSGEWLEDRLWCFFSPSLAELDFVDYKLLYGLSTPSSSSLLNNQSDQVRINPPP